MGPSPEHDTKKFPELANVNKNTKIPKLYSARGTLPEIREQTNITTELRVNPSHKDCSDCSEGLLQEPQSVAHTKPRDRFFGIFYLFQDVRNL